MIRVVRTSCFHNGCRIHVSIRLDIARFLANGSLAIVDAWLHQFWDSMGKQVRNLGCKTVLIQVFLEGLIQWSLYSVATFYDCSYEAIEQR